MSEPQSSLAKIREILLWLGAIIVVLTDLINIIELVKIERLLHR